MRAVPRKGKGAMYNGGLASLKSAAGLPIAHVPKRIAVHARRAKPLAIRTECDQRSIFPELFDQLARARIPHARRVVLAKPKSRRYPAPVRADGKTAGSGRAGWTFKMDRSPAVFHDYWVLLLRKTKG